MMATVALPTSDPADVGAASVGGSIRADRFRVARAGNPFTALGLCVDHLMNKPAYGALKFASWSKVLAGQINRGHYRLVLDEAGRVAALLGWAYADEAVAELWVRGEPVSFSGVAGDCVIFNIWSSETSEANAYVLDAARRAMRGRRYLYFRRFYPDGRSRPVKIEVGRFNDHHMARWTGAAANETIPGG